MLRGIIFSLVSVFENVKTEELPVEFFGKKNHNQRTWDFGYFQNSKKLQIR
jgi:hypothetical protein